MKSLILTHSLTQLRIIQQKHNFIKQNYVSSAHVCTSDQKSSDKLKIECDCSVWVQRQHLIWFRYFRISDWTEHLLPDI